MVYTKKSPALLIVGLIMLAIWFLASNGMMDPYIQHLGGSKYKYTSELTSIPLYFGILAAAFGLWQLFGSHREGHWDYYSSSVAGAMFILLIAMLVRWFVAPEVAVISHAFGKVGDTGKYIHKLLGLNYVVLGILTGIVIVNVFGVPKWAENGVRLSRLGLKTGVILLGTLYSAAELKNLGGLSIVMIGVFVLGSVGAVLWLGARMKIPNSMGGVLSAGMGVCGVSATVAAAPVVQAKSVEIAYTIGTILLWGVACMFVFPIIGNLFGMSYVQFGAWAGTGILNSAQVAGAALAYQPDGIETLKVAEIFNITRVLVLPIIVLWLAVWYVKREESAVAGQVNVGRVIFEKFPMFVIGFLIMFALSSTGIFAPPNHYKGKYFGNTVESGFKESNLLKDAQIAVLQAEAPKVQRENRKAALQRLIENRKIMSIDDDDALRGLVNAKILSRDANKILKGAHKAVRHTAKKIKAFRKWITWLFAFGLVGLGMQITISSMKQAGGQPAVIGAFVGLGKAVLSLIVVLILVSETI
ncbi:MAG TPA: putative sulfate exporter family transporter [Sedimenticola thiotaurini]|uniref:Sulfate exporter family transporter n=1 Tax=Sedimenticola thiotaurini TaxID=1543721 RepID=A0A831RMQ8_9GAMM|nr:putative sulfate exporter family transporter [Sedimenticola thiotaurini]